MAYNFSQFNTRSKEIAEWLKKELTSIQTGMASPALLDNILIESYGTQAPLKQSASITLEDARTLRVVPYDNGQVKAIEKGIIDSNLGLSVSVDGVGIRAMVPELTTETREKYAKLVKVKLEESRVSIRKERDHTLNDIRSKDLGLSEDEQKRAKEELEKHVKEGNDLLSEISDKKEKEILG
jgi:ribosome recycling factor